MNEKWSMKDLVDITLAVIGFALIIPLYTQVLIPLRRTLGVIHFEQLSQYQGPVNTVVDILFYGAIPLVYATVVGVLLTLRWTRNMRHTQGSSPGMNAQPD